MKVKEIMTPDPIRISVEKELHHLTSLMHAYHVRRVPIVNGFDDALGIEREQEHTVALPQPEVISTDAFCLQPLGGQCERHFHNGHRGHARHAVQAIVAAHPDFVEVREAALERLWEFGQLPQPVADVVLADLERELVPLGKREELFGHGEGVVDQLLRHAVIGDDEKPGVFTGAGNGTRQQRRRPLFAGEIRADIEHGNAAMG